MGDYNFDRLYTDMVIERWDYESFNFSLVYMFNFIYKEYGLCNKM